MFYMWGFVSSLSSLFDSPFKGLVVFHNDHAYLGFKVNQRIISFWFHHFRINRYIIGIFYPPIKVVRNLLLTSLARSFPCSDLTQFCFWTINLWLYVSPFIILIIDVFVGSYSSWLQYQQDQVHPNLEYLLTPNGWPCLFIFYGTVNELRPWNCRSCQPPPCHALEATWSFGHACS